MTDTATMPADPGEWRPGLPADVGMAAHPSMRRKTDDEIQTRLAQVERDLEEAPSTFVPSDDLDEYLASLRELRAGYRLALHWRGSA